MELNNVFINIGDEIQNWSGGGSYNDPKCNYIVNLKAIVKKLDYSNRQIEIEFICIEPETREEIQRKLPFIIKYSDLKEWQKWTVSQVSQLKNAIIELLNMNLIIIKIDVKN